MSLKPTQQSQARQACMLHERYEPDTGGQVLDILLCHCVVAQTSKRGKAFEITAALC